MIKIKSKWKFKAPMIANQILLVCRPIHAFYISQFCFCLLFPQIMFAAAKVKQRRPQVRLRHPEDPALLCSLTSNGCFLGTCWQLSSLRGSVVKYNLPAFWEWKGVQMTPEQQVWIAMVLVQWGHPGQWGIRLSPAPSCWLACKGNWNTYAVN